MIIVIGIIDCTWRLKTRLFEKWRNHSFEFLYALSGRDQSHIKNLFGEKASCGNTVLGTAIALSVSESMFTRKQHTLISRIHMFPLFGISKGQNSAHETKDMCRNRILTITLTLCCVLIGHWVADTPFCARGIPFLLVLWQEGSTRKKGMG